MKRLLIIILFTMSASMTFSQKIRSVKINDVVKMIDTSTSPLVLNFWATWCKPCITEIPWFEKAVADYQAKGVKLILVSLDLPEDYQKKNLQAFVKKNNYRSEVLWLNESNADKFCPPIDSLWGGAIPVTLMVNNQKNYRRFYDFQLKEERLRLELNKLVE